MSEAQVDKELVERARSGDKRAFDLLVLKYQQKVANVMRWINDNQYTVAFYLIGEDGKEIRMGLISYTRK